MQKSELRRLDLIDLIDSIGHGGIAKVAQAIGKDASYVSRMLYESGKPGKKPVSEKSADLLDEAFPGWNKRILLGTPIIPLSINPGNALRSIDTTPRVNVPALNAIERLKLALGRKPLPQDALDMLVSDLEAKLEWVKKHGANPRKPQGKA